MPYIEGRVVHDADAHIMELPTWLVDHADPEVRERLRPWAGGALAPGEVDELALLVQKHEEPGFLDRAAEEIMAWKNFKALGSFSAADRPRALDEIGVASQLVFNTFHNGRLVDWERGDDLDLAYGAARAHNRAMVEWCSVDDRLLPTCYVPLADFDRSAGIAGEAIAMGAAALLVPSACPRRHSPSHIGLDAVWRQAEEAGIPIVLHVGGGGRLIDPMFFENGLPYVKDFHGGDENFRSVDYMGIPRRPEQMLATLIFDGVLERHPALQIGVIEQGAIWLPSWMRQMESAFDAFARHEDRLQALSLRPSEYVRRQIKATPYPTEDVGWIVEQAGAETVLFSTDFPHVEGGRKPVERFEASLADASESVRQAFYCDNFIDLMGTAMAQVPVPA
ncbi:MAG: amidohydrolase [Actinomycetota bacterium]|nr:amidohydrolase [Actinomycetota bacterium]